MSSETGCVECNAPRAVCMNCDNPRCSHVMCANHAFKWVGTTPEASELICFLCFKQKEVATQHKDALRFVDVPRITKLFMVLENA